VSKKENKPKFQVQVKANVYFYAEMEGATSLEEALTKAREMKNSFNRLWEAPGDIIDTEIEIEGVSKA